MSAKRHPSDVLDTVADLIDRLDQAEARERALASENECYREALRPFRHALEVGDWSHATEYLEGRDWDKLREVMRLYE